MHEQTEQQRINSYLAAGVPLPTVPSTISSANTSQTGTIPVPSAVTDTTNFGGIINGVTNSIASSIQPPEITPATPVANETKSYLDRIKSLMGLTVDKTAFEQEQLKTSGATALESRQRELQGQITALNNEANAIPLKIQQEFTGRGATVGGVAPIQTADLRRNAIRALSISSEFTLNQGQLETARLQAGRAVDLKYKDAETQIEQYSKLLQVSLPFMNAEEKKIANAQATKNEAKKAELTDLKKLQTDIINNAQLSGQSDIASQAMQIDPNSPTVRQDLANLQRQVITKPKLDAGVIGEYQFAQSQGYRGSFIQYQNEDANRKLRASGIDVGSQDPAQMLGYIQQYASTGTIPTGIPKGSFGIISQGAKELPKHTGALLGIHTGVKPDLDALTEKGIIAMSEIVRTTLPELQRLFPKLYTGLLGGIGGAIFTTQNRQDYLTFRAEFLSKLLVARSGATVTPQEYERYSKLLPTTFDQSFFVGADGSKKLNSMFSAMKTNLDNSLASTQTAIVGYSTVKLGEKDYKVGDIIEVNGLRGHILSDGSIVPIQ